MNYTVNEEYYCAVIELKGKVMGGPDAHKFRDTLKELIDAGILIGGLTTMRNAGGDLRICNAMDRIESMLMVSQLNRVFELHSTVEEAIESFQEEEA